MKNKWYKLIVLILIAVVIVFVLVAKIAKRAGQKNVTDSTSRIAKSAQAPDIMRITQAESQSDECKKDSSATVNRIKPDKTVKAADTLPLNLIDKMLANGKLSIFDFGSTTCIPCKKMKPIIEELQKEYAGKVNVLLLDISENTDLTAKYKIRVIPTQIFFDKKGNENSRHEGFFPKEEIVNRLKELGVE